MYDLLSPSPKIDGLNSKVKASCTGNYDKCHEVKLWLLTYFYMMMRYAFPRQEKLKSKKLIEKLFAEGHSVNGYPIKLIYLKVALPYAVPVQAGVTVPKKNFKSAVERNRIKRLMREGYRLNKGMVFNNSEGSFAFLFLYLGKELPEFHQVETAMRAVLEKFTKKISNE